MASTNSDNRVTVVLGSQWGDEGKGIEMRNLFIINDFRKMDA